jgi:predicted small metal-binding protein
LRAGLDGDRDAMTRELKCRDIGFDCDAVIQADSDDEVITHAATHARQVHGMDHIDTDTEQAMRTQIHDA